MIFLVDNVHSSETFVVDFHRICHPNRSDLVVEHSTLIRHRIDTDSTVTQHGNCNGMMRRNRRQTDTIYELTIKSNDLFILPRFAVLCTTLQPFALLLIFRVFSGNSIRIQESGLSG